MGLLQVYYMYSIASSYGDVFIKMYRENHADSLASWLRIILPRLEAFIARMPEESMEREDARRLANDLKAFCGWLEMEVENVSSLG